MGLPSGPVAIMTDKAGAPQKKVKQGDNIGEFKIANHINHAAFAFDFYACSRRRMHGEIDAILRAPFTHYDLAARHVHVAGLDWRAWRRCL